MRSKLSLQRELAGTLKLGILHLELARLNKESRLFHLRDGEIYGHGEDEDLSRLSEHKGFTLNKEFEGKIICVGILISKGLEPSKSLILTMDLECMDPFVLHFGWTLSVLAWSN